MLISSDNPRDIEIDQFDYPLPEERIASFPLSERDASRLLIFQNGGIRENIFRNLADEIPSNAVLLFNDSRVIHARLRFLTPSGKSVEIFCLEPLAPADYPQNLQSRTAVNWLCLVGGNKHWKSGSLDLEINTTQGKVVLSAHKVQRSEGCFEIQFSWTNSAISFAELLAVGGLIPLPPYLHRDSRPEDEDRYQTIFAKQEGSVAAPTAGLHFTDSVFAQLDLKGVERLFVTLHVGAGTFKPVHAEKIGEHHMHEEMICVSLHTLQHLHDAVCQGRPIIPVGTTAMRVLESLYWHAAGGLGNPAQLNVDQWAPYAEETIKLSPAEALSKIILSLIDRGEIEIKGHTRLLVAPGYAFRYVDGLITNFHQPRSTLLLLVSALVGPSWRDIYQFALENNFRFLSYGDSSLLWRYSPPT
jgi:S-adenosylmethionine:tRNA ribosyltransferase-isomerase